MIIKEENVYYLSGNFTGCFNNECRFTFLSQFDCLSFFFSVKDTDIISPCIVKGAKICNDTQAGGKDRR